MSGSTAPADGMMHTWARRHGKVADSARARTEEHLVGNAAHGLAEPVKTPAPSGKKWVRRLATAGIATAALVVGVAMGSAADPTTSRECQGLESEMTEAEREINELSTQVAAELGETETALVAREGEIARAEEAARVQAASTSTRSSGTNAGPSGSASSGSTSGASRPFRNCTEAREAGAAPVYRDDPGYGPHLDRDNDGIGCE